MNELPRFEGGRTALLAAAAAGAAGLLLTAVGFAFDPQRAMLSYLIAFLYFLGLALGALALNMANYAARARWHVAIRRAMETVHAEEITKAAPSAGQLASWVGVCPGREESAGESRSNRSAKVSGPILDCKRVAHGLVSDYFV